jgi:hypothetical protein
MTALSALGIDDFAGFSPDSNQNMHSPTHRRPVWTNRQLLALNLLRIPSVKSDDVGKPERTVTILLAEGKGLNWLASYKLTGCASAKAENVVMAFIAGLTVYLFPLAINQHGAVWYEPIDNRIAFNRFWVVFVDVLAD